MVGQRQLADLRVGECGYGAMNLTWKPEQTPDEQAFRAIKLAVDGGMTFVNTGEFYGQPEPTLGLQLMSRFFEKYPDYVDKIFLSVKGAIAPGLKPDSSDESLRRSVTNINKLLKHKTMDLFEPARVDKSRPVEDVMRTLDALRKEGHFKYIGLSEVSAATIRKAHAVAPVAAVEVEYSPFSLDIEKNGVLDTCKELGITIIAYSPLGRGLLSGKIKSIDDIPEGDHRRNFDRFQPDILAHNHQTFEKLQAIATKNSITPVQLSLAWILSSWDRIIPIPGSTRPEGVQECLDACKVKLSEQDLKAIREILDRAEIKGGRYSAQAAAHLEG